MAYKTNSYNEKDEPILIDARSLCELTRCCRYTAEKIAEAAKARVKVEKRILYNFERIKNYINSISE